MYGLLKQVVTKNPTNYVDLYGYVLWFSVKEFRPMLQNYFEMTKEVLQWN